jgi:glycosyltransferase involved in cell wall biosynthesis/SAM-dependent methyltransferase
MSVTQHPPGISIVITAYNEGAELARTVESVRQNTRPPFEIIVVDDGSTDGSSQTLNGKDLKVIRHGERIGVAVSRNEASAIAGGDVLAYLDGHQRLSDGCLNQCAKVALQNGAIVWPDVRGLEDRGWTGHGASLRLCEKHGYFNARWHRGQPPNSLTSISTLVVPGYVMPRHVFSRVRWIGALRGWGASEPALTVKAFFLNIPILHLCGPLARHLFRNELPYSTPWESVWRNHALVARVCFEDRTWFDRWLPQVFERHMTDAIRRDLESPEVQAEHAEFLAARKKANGPSDDAFFERFGPIPPLSKPLPRHAEQDSGNGKLNNDEYIQQQRPRSRPGEYKTIRARVDAALNWMARNLPDGTLVGTRAFDVGTRDGYALESLQKFGAAEAAGIELVPETAAYAARRGRAVRQGDMRDIADGDGAWELVTSIHSLEHCPDPARAVAEMARVLRPGGWLFVVVPRESNPNCDPLHNCSFPSADALRQLITAEASLDPTTIKEDLGILAKGCRELRFLIQKRNAWGMGEYDSLVQ